MFTHPLTFTIPGLRDCGIAGNKTQFSICIDNQRFILRKLRDCCGILLQTAIFLRPNLLPTNFRLLPTRCRLLPIRYGNSRLRLTGKKAVLTAATSGCVLEKTLANHFPTHKGETEMNKYQNENL